MTSLIDRAAPRVAVELRDDHAREPHVLVEGLGGLHRVLADHRVDDEEGVLRLGVLSDRAHLAHQLLVDGQTTCGVEDHRVALDRLAVLEPLVADLHRVAAGDREDGHADLLAQHLELLDRAGAGHVGSHEEHLAAMLTLQEPRELGGGGRLSGALQAHHHDPGDAALGEGHRRVLEAHHRLELVLADLRELLDGADLQLPTPDDHAALRALADRLLFYAAEERLDHGEFDVGLEQGEAHVAERGLDVLGGQLADTSEAVLGGSEAFLQRFEHGGPGAQGRRGGVARAFADRQRTTHPRSACSACAPRLAPRLGFAFAEWISIDDAELGALVLETGLSDQARVSATHSLETQPRDTAPTRSPDAHTITARGPPWCGGARAGRVTVVSRGRPHAPHVSDAFAEVTSGTTRLQREAAAGGAGTRGARAGAAQSLTTNCREPSRRKATIW